MFGTGIAQKILDWELGKLYKLTAKDNNRFLCYFGTTGAVKAGYNILFVDLITPEFKQTNFPGAATINFPNTDDLGNEIIVMAIECHAFISKGGAEIPKYKV